MHLGFVIPWCDPGRWLWEYLPEGITGELISVAPEVSRAKRKGLPPYLAEFIHLWRSKPDLNRFDVLFTWELRSTVAVALARKFTGQRKAKFVPTGPILKGNLLKILPVLHWLLSDAERIICFSSKECEDYSRLLKLPVQKFLFLPTPWLADEEVSERDDGYILALGQSNRDYGTLIRASRGTDLPILIVAYDSSVLGGESPPPNVTVRYNTGHEETNALIAGASFHVVPLHARSHSAGQTVLLRAMARGKAVIVSDTPGVRDYVSEETTVLVPPADEEALRTTMLRLWSDKQERQQIGNAAAHSVRKDFGFPRFTERLVELANTLDFLHTSEDLPATHEMGTRLLCQERNESQRTPLREDSLAEGETSKGYRGGV